MTTAFLKSQYSENPPKKCLSQESLVGWEFDIAYVTAVSFIIFTIKYKLAELFVIIYQPFPIISLRTLTSGISFKWWSVCHNFITWYATRIYLQVLIVEYFQEFTWPTPSNITYENAVDQCKTYIQERTSAKACQSVVQATFTAGLESCVEDIQVLWTKGNINVLGLPF